MSLCVSVRRVYVHLYLTDMSILKSIMSAIALFRIYLFCLVVIVVYWRGL